MKKEVKQIGYALQAIRNEQFATFEENFSPKYKTELGTGLQIKLTQSGKQIGIFLGFEFIQSEKIFIKIEVSCHFKIDEDSWKGFIQKKGTELVVPQGFLLQLAMHTTGTARGVLFAKTEGTQLAKFIIPTLDLSEMIPEDAAFDIEAD